MRVVHKLGIKNYYDKVVVLTASYLFWFLNLICCCFFGLIAPAPAGIPAMSKDQRSAGIASGALAVDDFSLIFDICHFQSCSSF